MGRVCHHTLLLLTLLLALGAAACDEGASGPQEVSLRVTTINLRHEADWWEDRFPLLATESVALAADLMGMQEVGTKTMQDEVLRDLILGEDASLDYTSVVTPKAEPFATLTGEAVATLTLRPVVESSKGYLTEGRVVSFLRVDVGRGARVDHYNTHLHAIAADDAVRDEQVEALLEFVEENDEGWPIVVTGDFNATDDEDCIGLMRDAGFVDTFVALHGDAANTDGATSPVVLAREPAEQAFTRRIDYVFFRPGTKAEAAEAVRAEVTYQTPAADGLYPSDHLGVTVDFDLVFE